MGVSRRGFLGTSAATVSAAVLARTAGAQHHAPQDRPGAKADQKRRVGPRPMEGDYNGGLLIVFEGLCAAVTDPPSGKVGDRRLDVGLVATKGLKNPAVHAHLPTLALSRSIIQDVTGLTPVGADVQNTFFNLKGYRMRFVPPMGTKSLSINDSVAVADCPKTAEEWANFNWLLDFQTEVDTRPEAGLLETWRSLTDLDALVELRHGSVEDISLATPEAPGNDSARVFELSATKKKRGLKEHLRILLDTPQVEIHLWPLGTTGTPTGVIKLDCKDESHVVTVSQLPYKYESESHNMKDMAALWLLTRGGVGDVNVLTDRLPRPVMDKEPCTIGATDGCGCCPTPRFVEQTWRGHQ